MSHPITIAVSAAAADAGKSGIGRYIAETLRHLGGDSHLETRFIVYVTESDRIVTADLPASFDIRTVKGFWATTLGNILWHLVMFPVLLRLNRCDQVIFLAANRRLGLTPGTPSIGVVHDLSQLHVPGKYDAFRTFYVLSLLPVLMRRLDQVVCVSRSTARDVIEYARVKKSRVIVNYNGVDVTTFASRQKTSARRAVKRELGIDSPYMLYTARLEHPGKNHVNLLESLAVLKSRGRLRHKAVLAGSRWNGAEIIEQRIRELNLTDDVILTGFVSDDLLPALVSAADLFVFPSLFEGFGIPALEAMACGTVVVASNTSSLPEVVGDAGLLFDPTNPLNMADVISEALDAPALRRALAARGRRRVTAFSWRRSATALYGISRRLLNLKAGPMNRVSETLGVSQ
jgi:glycosyltransferase involved in cell wall biosynthesis